MGLGPVGRGIVAATFVGAVVGAVVGIAAPFVPFVAVAVAAAAASAGFPSVSRTFFSVQRTKIGALGRRQPGASCLGSRSRPGAGMSGYDAASLASLPLPLAREPGGAGRQSNPRSN